LIIHIANTHPQTERPLRTHRPDEHCNY
jgi:hypothetical protein